MKDDDIEKMAIQKEWNKWTRECIDRNTEQIRLSCKAIRESVDKLNETVTGISKLFDKLNETMDGLAKGFQAYNSTMTKLNERLGNEQLQK